MLLVGKHTISMVIFNSYVKLPEGSLRLGGARAITSSVAVKWSHFLQAKTSHQRVREEFAVGVPG